MARLTSFVYVMDIYITLDLLWVCYQAFYMIQVPMQRIATIFFKK